MDMLKLPAPKKVTHKLPLKLVGSARNVGEVVTQIERGVNQNPNAMAGIPTPT
jgi:hypothetical protein